MLSGRSLLLGDHVNTDDIIAGKYLRAKDPLVWRDHIFENLDPNLSTAIKTRAFIVAGENFGCGSSREQAALSIKLCGIEAIIARSYGRIFYRNCINVGLLPIIVPNSRECINDNEDLTIDWQQSLIHTSNTTIKFYNLDHLLLDIYRAGGLIDYYCRYGKLNPT